MSGSTTVTEGSPSSEEKDMIKTLIRYIKDMIEHKFDLLSVIERPLMLVEALEELDELIEMYDIKKSISHQIQLMVVLAYRRHIDGKDGSKFDGHMLHGVIYGPPGVGKSTAAKCIAKIFYAIGVIDQLAKNARKCSSAGSQLPIPGASGSSGSSDPKILIIPSQSSISGDAIAHEAGELLRAINGFRRGVKAHVDKCKDCEKCCAHQEHKLMLSTSLEMGLKCTNIIGLCQTNDECEEEESGNDSPPPGIVRLPPLVPPGAATHKTLPPTLPATGTAVASSLVPWVPPQATAPTAAEVYPIVLAGRTEFVGEYAGQTTPKANKFLMENRGKVVIIEEAYLLYTGEKDQFGLEALTEINRFMDEHASEIIIYLTGYKELMEQTIFKAQPGLKRRCEQVFNIKGYSAAGLARIFEHQLRVNGWEICQSINCAKYFDRRMKHFKAYGGDTLKLVFQCKQVFSAEAFATLCKGLVKVTTEGAEKPTLPKFEICQRVLDAAFIEFCNHQVKEAELPPPPFGMYL